MSVIAVESVSLPECNGCKLNCTARTLLEIAAQVAIARAKRTEKPSQPPRESYPFVVSGKTFQQTFYESGATHLVGNISSPFGELSVSIGVNRHCPAGKGSTGQVHGVEVLQL